MRPNDLDPTRGFDPPPDPYARPLGSPDGAAEGDPYSRPSAPPDDANARPDAPEAYGVLRVRVTTARGALPVCGAHVFVSPCAGGGVCAACTTDDSGLSRAFSLPTVSASLSAIGEAPPCARYDVEVLAEGFEAATFAAVPVYDGVTSLQCAELIPKAAGGARRG